MIPKKLFCITVLAVGTLSLGMRASAYDKEKTQTETKNKKKAEAKAESATPLEEMDADTAKEYGGMIAGLFTKQLKDAQLKMEPDVDKAVGLVNLGTREGIIAIPAKGWKEDRENKAVESDTGVGMCYLFMSPTYNPLIDGKPADGKKLRVVKFTDGDGNERTATCLLCSVKHVEGDDWQLFVWGSEKQPVIKSQWGEASDAPKADLALAIQDPTKDKAQLVFNIFGKYSSTIEIAHKHKDK